MKMEGIRKIMILLIIAMLASAGVAFGEITGAVGCNAGELVVLNSDKESVWTVYPSEYSASYAVSDDGRTIYFASPKTGKVTFFAASVVDGLPCLESHSLFNGLELPDPAPTPTPAPEPVVDETIEGVVKSEGEGKSAEKLTALAETFEFVSDGINRGTIRTTAGARETFRKEWLRKSALTNPDSLEEMGSLIEKVGSMIDYSSLESVKKDFSRVATALREQVPKLKSEKAESEKPEEEEAKKEESEKEVEDNQKSCPNGTCPNGTCPNGTCPNVQNYNGGFFRWR